MTADPLDDGHRPPIPIDPATSNETESVSFRSQAFLYFWGTCLQIVAVALFIGAILYITYHSLQLWPVFWGFLAVALAQTLFVAGKKLKLPDAATAIEKDPRPPVLFLRSFVDDEIVLQKKYRLVEPDRVTLEEPIVDVVRSIGPAIALAKPGEKTPPFGAARLRVDGDWKEATRDLIDRSNIVFVLAGSSPGLAWEIDELFGRRDEKRILVVLPPPTHRRETNPWREFVLTAAEAGVEDLPETVPRNTLFAEFSGKRLIGLLEGAGNFEALDYKTTLRRALDPE